MSDRRFQMPRDFSRLLIPSGLRVAALGCYISRGFAFVHRMLRETNFVEPSPTKVKGVREILRSRLPVYAGGKRAQACAELNYYAWRNVARSPNMFVRLERRDLYLLYMSGDQKAGGVFFARTDVYLQPMTLPAVPARSDLEAHDILIESKEVGVQAESAPFFRHFFRRPLLR